MKSETHPNFHFKRRQTNTQARKTPGCPQGGGGHNGGGGGSVLATSPVCPSQIMSWNTRTVRILRIVSSPGPRLSPGPGAQRAPMSPCPRGDTASFPTFSRLGVFSNFSLPAPRLPASSASRAASKFRPRAQGVVGSGQRRSALGAPEGAQTRPGDRRLSQGGDWECHRSPESPQRSEWAILETNADGSPLECVQTRPGRKLERQ